MQQKHRLPLLQPKQLRLLLFVAAAVIRGLLVIYCEWHDRNMKVRFTDIDYKVYTDAAQRVLDGGSPYERHTYRYSPLVNSSSNNTNSSSNNKNSSSDSSSSSSSRWCLGWFVLRAYLCLPNLLGLPFFGKVLFCCMDIAVALLIEVCLRKLETTASPAAHETLGCTYTFPCLLVLPAFLIQEGLRRMHRARMQQQGQQQQQQFAAAGEIQQSASSHFTIDRKQALPSSTSNDSSSSSSSGSSSKEVDADDYPLHTFVLPCCCWLYNPIVATVSVRGNADALPCLLVLLTVSALRRQAIFLAAIVLRPPAAAAAAAAGSALPRRLRHPNAAISAARSSRQPAAALAASSACFSAAAAAAAKLLLIL
ncbi:hypothetical protein Emag_001614 [Eimeria magna]